MHLRSTLLSKLGALTLVAFGCVPFSTSSLDELSAGGHRGRDVVNEAGAAGEETEIAGSGGETSEGAGGEGAAFGGEGGVTGEPECALSEGGCGALGGSSGGGAGEPPVLDIQFSDDYSTPVYGAAEGTTFIDRCPDGQVVVAYHGDLHPDKAWLRRIQTQCARIEISKTEPFTVVLTPATALPIRGELTGNFYTLECPAQHIPVGFKSRSGLYVDSLALHCAKVEVVKTDTGYTLSLGTPTQTTPVGGPGGYDMPITFCNSGQLAVGTQVRADVAIRAFGLMCATPAVTVQ